MSVYTIVNSFPTFITPEEHAVRTSVTPASFSDIPPVLRHKEENVSASIDPAVEGFSPAEGETLKGTLYVVESALYFMTEDTKGLKIEYRAITLHAVSRSDSGEPHLYCQLEEPFDENAAHKEDEDSEMSELKLIPQSPESLEAIFEALSACAALHPDPVVDSDDDMGLGDGAFVDADEVDPSEFFTGEGEEPEFTEAGRRTLDRLEAMLEQNERPKESKSLTNGSHEESEKGSPSRSPAPDVLSENQ